MLTSGQIDRLSRANRFDEFLDIYRTFDNPFLEEPTEELYLTIVGRGIGNAMKEGKPNLKDRHATARIRNYYHNPASDWKESDRGDVCVNACSLEVKDIIEKHNKKTTA
jgi:hypothetical protein